MSISCSNTFCRLNDRILRATSRARTTVVPECPKTRLTNRTTTARSPPNKTSRPTASKCDKSSNHQPLQPSSNNNLPSSNTRIRMARALKSEKRTRTICSINSPVRSGTMLTKSARSTLSVRTRLVYPRDCKLRRTECVAPVTWRTISRRGRRRLFESCLHCQMQNSNKCRTMADYRSKYRRHSPPAHSAKNRHQAQAASQSSFRSLTSLKMLKCQQKLYSRADPPTMPTRACASPKAAFTSPSFVANRLKAVKATSNSSCSRILRQCSSNSNRKRNSRSKRVRRSRPLRNHRRRREKCLQ